MATDLCSGTPPRNGIFCSSAHAFAPPWPKISSRLPQLSHSYQLMFSTSPTTGTFSVRNMETAFCTSMSATSCGVETTTAPVSGQDCARLSATSPVPGGRSTMR